MGFLLSFLARRLAQGLLIVLLVSFGIFAILRLVPGDPVRMILGPMANATG
jgi:ABC-type dipeptide/oligopeptide/nickel transport system permease component